MQKRTIKLENHNNNWEHLFISASKELSGIFGKRCIKLHHIGSTAVKGILAKPIIDILIEARDISEIDALNPLMQEAGYTPKGEYGIEGRRFFQRFEGANPTHHVHVFEAGHPEIIRHIHFRDYLNAHPESAASYSSLKLALSKKYPHDIEGYCEGKSSLIKDIDKQAADFYNNA